MGTEKYILGQAIGNGGDIGSACQILRFTRNSSSRETFFQEGFRACVIHGCNHSLLLKH